VCTHVTIYVGQGQGQAGQTQGNNAPIRNPLLSQNSATTTSTEQLLSDEEFARRLASEDDEAAAAAAAVAEGKLQSDSISCENVYLCVD
jgi:hypothetical protein